MQHREEGIATMKLRSWVLLSIPLLFLAALVFHRPLLCWGLKHALAQQLSYLKPSTLSYEHLGYNEGALYLDGIQFIHKSSQEQLLSIDRLECYLLLNTPSHLVDTTYKLVRPIITWRKSQQKMVWHDGALQKMLSKASVTKKLQIEDGYITSDDKKASFHFSFLPGKEGLHIGSLTVALPSVDGNKECISLDLYEDVKNLSAKVRFSEAPMEAFNPLLSLCCKEVSFQGGIVEGEIQIGITLDGRLHQLKSDIRLQELVGIKEDSLVKVSECRLRNMLPLNHQDLIDIKHLSLASLMRYLVSTYEIEGGFADLRYSKTGAQWQFTDVEGMFTCNLAHTPHLSIKGFLEHHQTVYPFALEGKGLVESEQNWWMDIDISPLNQETGAIEPKKTPIYIALLDGKEHFIKVSVQQLEISIIKMLQEVGQIYFPSLADLDITAASVSTDMMMKVQNGKIQALLLEGLTCSSLEGKWKQWDLTCTELKGRMKLHFPLFMTMKSPVWDLSFHGVCIKNDLGKLLVESSGMISSKDWKVASSWITTRCEGIVGEWTLSGPYAELDVSGSLALDEKHGASQLQQEVLNVAPHMQRLTALACFCKVKYSPEKISLSGVTNLSYEHALVDKLRFGLDFMIGKLRQGNFIPDGWFQSDGLSENTYLWFVKYYHQKWHALGSMQVTGEIHEGSLQFALDSHEALYESEDIIVTMEPKEKLYHGDFLFDTCKKSWLIHLPIRDVKCIDKKFHLPFEHVDADVKIEGTQLYAERMSALCEGVLFGGRLELSFADPEWIDLKLYPSSIEAQAQDFLKFMRYLPDFKHICIPVYGRVQGRGLNYLCTRYNQTQSTKTARIGLQIDQGVYECNPHCSIHNLSGELLWDSAQDVLEVRHVQGDLLLARDEEKKQYHLNMQNLKASSLEEGRWEFDVRLESPTLDILRVVGLAIKDQEGWAISMQPHATHFFGTKMQACEIYFDQSGNSTKMQMQADLALVDIVQQMHLAYLAGLIDVSYPLLQEIRHLKTEGEISCSLSYHKGTMQMDLISPQLEIGAIKVEDFCSTVTTQQQKSTLDLKTKESCIHAELEREGGDWELSLLEAAYKNSSLALGAGTYRNGKVEMELDRLLVDLQELYNLCAPTKMSHRLMKGMLQAHGRLFIDFSAGFKQAKFSSQLVVNSESLGDAGFEITSKLPMKVSYSYEKGVEVEHLTMHVQKEGLEEVWASIQMRHMQFFMQEGSFFAKGIKLILPPEMSRYLAEIGWIPHVEYRNHQLCFFDKTFAWDNQLETECSLLYDCRGLQIEGVAKDGYYWIGSRSVYFQNIQYHFKQNHLSVALGWDYKDISLDFATKIYLKEGIDAFKDGIEAKVMIKEGHGEDSDERSGLEIACRYLSTEGLCFQSIEGTLYGVHFSFRRNPRTYLPHETVLTGQMKIDTAGLVKAFPKLFYQTIKDLGMGSGYELSGDWVLSRENLASSYFKGFLKGRDFEFLGFYFKTLLSEVRIESQHVIMHDFRLSDMSGVAQIKEAWIKKEEEGWKLEIPEIALQDFRPSFLKKTDGQEERIKPFVIKDLHFFDIQGFLGNKDSFSGRGHLDFVNTFKKETNLLDLPIEIIGRIGFDLGLFVPVVGKIDFEMTEGKIFLRELKEAYSEGKRSRFYLPSHKESYIGLDGSVAIDIKMKQYVLLKITQPFTLSIRGTLIKPKYSLRSAK